MNSIEKQNHINIKYLTDGGKDGKARQLERNRMHLERCGTLEVKR